MIFLSLENILEDIQMGVKSQYKLLNGNEEIQKEELLSHLETYQKDEKKYIK
jgi:hypothetical protein